MTATITTEIIYDRGAPVRVNGICVDNKRLVILGRFLRIARLQDEWYQDVGDPESISAALRKCDPRPDIFTFWQRLPDIAPLFPYHNEPEALSAIPLKTYQQWWEKQIKTDTRKKAKRAEKRGIEIRTVSLDDQFIRGVMGIFSETPVRRGKPFWHYGKDFETVKEELSRDLETSKFIGAYHEGDLVGFVKLVYATRRFANPGLILSKLEFRNRYVNDALVAKAVEVCAQDAIPYLTYTNWRRGSQAAFLIRHGFERVLVPRYWIPLSKKGALSLKMGFHRSLRSYVPDPLWGFLLDLRGRFYHTWHKTGGQEDESGFD